MKITRKMLERIGYTEDCEGCRYMQAGMDESRPHTERCRKRIEEEMKKIQDGQMRLKEQEHRRTAKEKKDEAKEADPTAEQKSSVEPPSGYQENREEGDGRPGSSGDLSSNQDHGENQNGS